MVDFKIVYFCNCVDEWMREYLKYAVLSALRFVPKKNINIFFHPPLLNLDEITDTFDRLGNLTVFEENLYPSWAGHPKNIGTDRWYSEEMRLCDLEDENVLLLESDTFTYSHPKKLMEGEFDFGGIPMDKFPNHWIPRRRLKACAQNVWKLDPRRTHIWNACIIGFRNNAHHIIKDDWIKIDQDEKGKMDLCLPPNRKIYTQLAIAPAVARSNLRLREYKVNDDIFLLNSNTKVSEINDDVAVIHGNDLANKLGMKEELDEFYKEF